MTTTRKPPKAVLFDLDHTLLDFDRAQRRALAETLGSIGLATSRSTVTAFRSINDAIWERYRRGQISGDDLSVERFRLLLGRIGVSRRHAAPLSCVFLSRLAQHGDLLPGCRPMLRTLARRFRLGVVTNGYDRVQRSRLAAARLTPLFEVVVTSESSGYAKPDPRILGVALAALGIRADEALYIGDDAKTDGGAARAAGVPFCWIDHGAPPAPGIPRPRRRVGSLAELTRKLAL